MLRCRYILLFLAVILYACNNHNNPAETPAQPQETDVPLSFTFIGTLPPYEEDLSATLLKSFNTASINGARKNHADSALVLLDDDSLAADKEAPVYADISFFPVMQKDTLEKTYRGSFNKKKSSDSAATIDFSQYFAFVVTHPPTANVSYYNILSEKHLPGDTLHLSLMSNPMNSEESTVSLSSFWATSVYKVQKGNYHVLAVEYRRDTSFFQLK